MYMNQQTHDFRLTETLSEEQNTILAWENCTGHHDDGVEEQNSSATNGSHSGTLQHHQGHVHKHE